MPDDVIGRRWKQSREDQFEMKIERDVDAGVSICDEERGK